MIWCSCGWSNSELRSRCRNCGLSVSLDLETEKFSVEELGYQRTGEDTWESPDGTVVQGFPGKGPPVVERIKRST